MNVLERVQRWNNSSHKVPNPRSSESSISDATLSALTQRGSFCNDAVRDDSTNADRVSCIRKPA